ncbi:MAG: membrane dipeptidase [Clostridia bacterium]|nr:membrane dipeptidase [Clostridia bacterium]
MDIFDTHSDTPFELFRKNLDLYNDVTDVSLGRIERFGRKFFVSAFFCDNNKTDAESYEEFLESNAHFDTLIQKYPDKVMPCKTSADIKKCADRGICGIIKAVEDVRLIGKSLERLDVLYDAGVRQVLPVWGGVSNIGGAWDSDLGLTSFGKQVVRRCEELGIVVDVSHMSQKSFYDTAEHCDKPFVASHSNYADICSHGRNLKKDQLCEIIRRGGIVGLNLCCRHVKSKYETREVTLLDDFTGELSQHIYYCLEMGGEKTVCLGCDWDGTKMTPLIRNVSEIDKLYERLIKDGISEGTADDIFFNNAYNFYINNLK